ncbi:MAG: hypothetical protein NC132_05530 [Corallococcus sp.]|nr:hypothetical protein [Corallococcus sp.]MCM1359997.1 hypothetical protein [Corallococcus sp.]MCM1395554.1 hypothetical protein [Corallococcus sp.]
MKNLSEKARTYQLEHGHTSVGALKRGARATQFTYGLLKIKRIKTVYAHGIEGGDTQAEIETVCGITPEIGDGITLASGQTGIVTEVLQETLDEMQLRFVGFNKADKITRISVRYV